MSLAIIYTRAKVGIEAPLVTVEVHLSNGLPGMTMVGLPETAVRESKDRVRSAILNAHFEFPQRRITINLAPADLPKEGGRFDLAIALGILAASGQVRGDLLQDYEFLGELALTGELRSVQGGLPASMACRQAKRQLCVPTNNTEEALLPRQAQVFGAAHLLDVTAHLNGQVKLPLLQSKPAQKQRSKVYPCLSDIKGQQAAKRALEVAAAGRHNLLFYGPPGTGKTLLASRLSSILPPMTENEMLEVAAIHSIAGKKQTDRYQRPFRSPHHTASGVALVGGGSNPRPGEITLAHHGVLFLDELPEFSRSVLDVLREPLESGEIVISRAARQIHFPAQFQLIAAMNPTPGGYAADDPRSAGYSAEQIRRYMNRVSGPFLDRIDMHVEVSPIPTRVLSEQATGETSERVRQRVEAAYQRQLQRQDKSNTQLQPREVDQFCVLQPADAELLQQAIDRLGLSARSYHRILKVSRTLADLEQSDQIARHHLTEALGYRQLDRLSG